MCRFFISYHHSPVAITPLISEFAQYSKNTPAPDGDWQGDGWGMLTNGGKIETYVSLKPIWEDMNYNPNPKPASKLLVLHARSATFKSQLNDVSFQQPFWNDRYAFVFNGFLPNITISSPYFSGVSGAQKIWSFLSHMLDLYDPQIALSKTVHILKKKSAEPKAINIGLVDVTDGATWCYTYYDRFSHYYHIHYKKEGDGFSLITGSMPSQDVTAKIPFDTVYPLGVRGGNGHRKKLI